jgi:hypothetical protein
MEFKTRTGRRVSVDMQAAYAPQESQQESPQAEGQSPPAATKPTFEELIKGEYKDDFGKHVSSIVQDRLKNSKQAEETLGKLTPALEALFKKNGIADGDIDGLVKKITDDDSLYE